jgi:hypothetical protein
VIIHCFFRCICWSFIHHSMGCVSLVRVVCLHWADKFLLLLTVLSWWYSSMCSVNMNLQQVVANLTAKMSQCVAAHWPSGKPVTLTPGRYLVDFESHTRRGLYAPHHQSKMELHHNKSSENAKVWRVRILVFVQLLFAVVIRY